MKPICVPCKLFFRPKRNGTAFIEGMPIAGGWQPYKLWIGDLWKCVGCGAEVIVGVGAGPIAEHFEPGFKDKCEKRQDRKELIQINDC
jgi:hypothetical protein